MGEDGPTHQPIEQLASLRAIPGLMVLRPADANEVVEAWRVIMELKHEPAVLVLTRGAVPTLDRERYASASGAGAGRVRARGSRGRSAGGAAAGHGSEVALCVAAYEQLKSEGMRARVVSMPSWELFEKQSQMYRDSVLPPSVSARVVVEAASGFGWAHYAGNDGAILAMETLGPRRRSSSSCRSTASRRSTWWARPKSRLPERAAWPSRAG